MSDSKKDSSNKKINIKNKKEATKNIDAKKNTVTKAKKASTTKNKNKTVKTNSNPGLKISDKDKIEKKKKQSKNVEDKKKKTKKNTKTEEKTKLVLPKEWQQIKPTTKKKKTGTKTEPDNLSSRLKSKIFEEIDEKQLIAEKKKNKEKNKKNLIKLSILAVVILVTCFFLIKYNENIQKQLKVYREYTTGEKIILKDNSVWYVVEDSDNKTPTLKLLKETQIDVNNDGKFDNKDKMKYNSSNKDSYDITDEESVAYYLENEYKDYLTEKVGTIESISILTSKEFVKARGKMGYDYEWTEGNWLANNNLGTWWINSSQNGKVYAVTRIGSYKLYSANVTNYVRPVITINKDVVEKKD